MRDRQIHCIALFTLSLVVATGETYLPGRKLLNDCADGEETPCLDCKAQRFVNWPGFDMLFEPTRTDTAQACCDTCKRRHGCRVWLWKGESECWLKEDIGFPLPCSDCIGGILDEDPFAALNVCRAAGRQCADRAAQAGCLEVRNVCNAPFLKDTVLPYPSDRASVKDFEKREARVMCKFLMRQTCKATAQEAARRLDGECHSLIATHGPATLTQGCSSRRQAERMFGSISDAICEGMI